MKIAIAGSEIIDRGHAYVPQMRALVGNNLIASPGARAVIRRRSGAEEVLLHRRRDFGVWALPAGSPLIGESILDCLRREVFEETDLEQLIEVRHFHFRRNESLQSLHGIARAFDQLHGQ